MNTSKILSTALSISLLSGCTFLQNKTKNKVSGVCSNIANQYIEHNINYIELKKRLQKKTYAILENTENFSKSEGIQLLNQEEEKIFKDNSEIYEFLSYTQKNLIEIEKKFDECMKY